MEFDTRPISISKHTIPIHIPSQTTQPSSLAMSALFFPPPPSLVLTAVSVVSFTTLAYTGISEALGKHLQYSKFQDAVSPLDWALKLRLPRLSSRDGMLFLYTPALLAGVASFAGFPVPVAWEGSRGFLLCSALTIHFLKRVLEVLFVHKYSGHMTLNSTLPISLSYFVGTIGMIYAQYVSMGMPEPSFDLKYIGVILFLVGISGNFYHHYLLSKLREKNDKGYKIPRGGLFGLVICPHYLFEIIGFIGFTFISQTLYSLLFTLGTVFYLTGRSYATRRWYLSKFENFPKEVKALVPYIY